MSPSAVRVATATGLALAAALLMTACGGSPTRPSPNPGGGNGGGSQQPPPNNLPVIDSITIQGSVAKEPANFADLSDTVTVSAKVHDDETPVDQLQFEWTASAGTFSGTGANVTWQAPASAATPIDVTITLKLTEKYGPLAAFQHDVSSTAKVSLHDSVKEVGDMARQFLVDFSDSSIRDIDLIMRNFSRSKCPDPREVDSERNDVTNNRANFKIVSSRIGAATVDVRFGGTCPFRGKQGDACAVVPSFWDSIDLRDSSRGAVDGNDIVAAVYAAQDARWWLCASDYDGHNAFGASRRGFIR